MGRVVGVATVRVHADGGVDEAIFVHHPHLQAGEILILGPRHHLSVAGLQEVQCVAVELDSDAAIRIRVQHLPAADGRDPSVIQAGEHISGCFEGRCVPVRRWILAQRSEERLTLDQLQVLIEEEERSTESTRAEVVADDEGLRLIDFGLGEEDVQEFRVGNDLEEEDSRVPRLLVTGNGLDLDCERTQAAGGVEVHEGVSVQELRLVLELAVHVGIVEPDEGERHVRGALLVEERLEELRPVQDLGDRSRHAALLDRRNGDAELVVLGRLRGVSTAATAFVTRTQQCESCECQKRDQFHVSFPHALFVRDVGQWLGTISKIRATKATRWTLTPSAVRH